MEPSIFTRIINGEIPCEKVYEDDKTIAILDIHPMQPGHVLVVPKTQIAEFQDLNPLDYEALFRTVRHVSIRLKEVFPEKRVGIKVIGLDVAHAHVHVIPFSTLDEYRGHADMQAEPNHAALAAMAEKLAF